MYRTKLTIHKNLLAAILMLGMFATAIPAETFAASHREAPQISGDPKADATDVYAFVSPDKKDTVTLIANYVPFQEPAGGPNFYGLADDVLYEIKIDNDGDALEDIAYQFKFKTTIKNKKTFLYNTGAIGVLGDATQNMSQTYTLTRVDYAKAGKGKGKGERKMTSTVLGSNLMVPPSNIGPKSTPQYKKLRDAAVKTVGDTKVFAGQSDDPFFVDLGGIFDLLTIRKLPGNDGGGVDGLKGYSVQSLALQIPIKNLTKNGDKPTDIANGDSVIGVWTTASRQSVRVMESGKNKNSGDWVQVSRLGAPLVNEVVIPLGDKDLWNGSKPSADVQFANYVTDPELGGLLKALYGIKVPPQGAFGTDKARDDLVAIFLTGIKGLTQPTKVTPSEQLRLNVAVPVTAKPNSIGVVGGDNQGYPNGRRLADDVVDISLKAVAGAAYPLFHPSFTPDPLAAQLGDGVDKNDKSFGSSFPYLALPESGFDSVPHGS